MNSQIDVIERKVHERDVLLTEKDEDEPIIHRSFFKPIILNTLWGMIKFLTLIYSLFTACALIMLLARNNMETLQFTVYNIIFELLMCIFVIHDAFAAGGWRPGVSNSLWLIKFAKSIPYNSYNQYFTSIPKNYLRAGLLIFVASINHYNNENDQEKKSSGLQYVRDLNIMMIIFGLIFLCIGYIGKIKKKFISFYSDWVMENNLDFHSKQQVLYETTTCSGWISMCWNIIFFLFAIAAYGIIIGTMYDSLPVYVIIACIAKCVLSILIIIYLIVHRHVVIKINWCSAFILFFTLNVSLNLLYDFDPQISINKYVIYAWFVSLLIELIRFIIVYILYRNSMYRYYTPFKLMCRQIAEWTHFWLTKQGITKIGLVLILLALPFLFMTMTLDWFNIDMEFTTFFDFKNPLDLKIEDLKGFLKIFEDIYDEIKEFLDVTEDFDIPDGAMCGLIIGAFAAILGASVWPGAASAAGSAYQIVRIQKIIKRIVMLFKKIFKALKALVSKIRKILKKLVQMRKRVYKFLKILNKIGPKFLGMSSLVGLFGIILIPATTVVIILILSFFDRSLRFNKFQLSAYTQHGLWLLFTSFLLLLNMANLLVITTLKALLEEIFVFETVVFESEVVLLEGYNACFALHLLVIIGLVFFIIDRLLIKFYGKSSFYQWRSKALNNEKDNILKSYIKCKQSTPCVQQCLSHLVKNYEFDECNDFMSYQNMSQCIMSLDGLQNENEEIVNIILNLCWCCIEYNKFDRKKEIKHKEWEYFLTAYKIGSFPMTQPAQARNMQNELQLKELTPTLFASNDNVTYYEFNKQSSKQVTTLNLSACKQIIIYLRTGSLHDYERISDDDFAVTLLMNLSEKQLINLLHRFDENIWRLLIAVDAIHDTSVTVNEMSMTAVSPKGLRIPQNPSDESLSDGNDIEQETKYNETDEIELQRLPSGWRQIVNDKGQTYYHNDIIDKTQWERPQFTIKKKEKKKLKEAEEEKEEELPAYWKEITNDDGLVYYHNDKLQKTQWERPAKPGATKETGVQFDKTIGIKNVATQTGMTTNGIFKTKAIYHEFFQIALKDISIDTKIINQTTFEIAVKRNDETLVDLIDKQWIKMNETLLMSFNTDNDFVDGIDTPYKVLNALNDDTKRVNIIILASENGVISAKKWYQYLVESLMEYNRNNTDNEVIILHPSEQHYEVWCIYIILSVIVTIFALFSITNYGFISFEYEPDIEISNSVSSLSLSKEALTAEWDIEGFESINEFAKAGNNQFVDCDIGSIFMLIAGSLGLGKFKGFSSFLSGMFDVFKWDDIPFIDLLDINFDFDFDLDIDILNFPMIDILTWPSITIPIYGEWYMLMLFAPLFCLIACCCLFILGLKKKKIEINKQQIGLYIIWGGFLCVEFVLALASMLSTVSTFLPNSRVLIKYEYGYYYIILSNILVMFIGVMIWLDVMFGEPIPLLSTIFNDKKNKK